MAILVTGAAGFIGSHLSARLLDEGNEVIGLDSFTDYYDPRLKRRNISGLIESPRFRLITSDVRDAEFGPILDSVDTVFHEAAQPGVRASWGDHFRDYATINVEGTQRLLEACVRHGGVKRFIYASSSSIYGDALRFPIREDEPKVPISPYGVTKLAGELLVGLYALQHGLPATSLRYFTVYGPRQRPDMVFHRFLRAIHEGRDLIVYGDGGQTRDFTFVSDAVEANILALSAKTAPGEAFNVGGGSQVSLMTVIGIMERITGKKARIVHRETVPGDVRDTGSDVSRARERFGYAPQVSLEEGLRRMNDWMTRFLQETEE
jgi:nucleoside-diphosphate-sugar epimerase